MQPAALRPRSMAPAPKRSRCVAAAIAAAICGAGLLAVADPAAAMRTSPGPGGARATRTGVQVSLHGRTAPIPDAAMVPRPQATPIQGWSAPALSWMVALGAAPTAMDPGEAREPPRSAAPVAMIAAPPLDERGLVRFGERTMRPSRTLWMTVTAYSPDARSCPGTDDGITASGYSVWTNGGFMVAADTSLLPFGTVVSVPGYDDGRPVPVLDRGGAIRGMRLDVLFPTHEAARRWGVRRVAVTVYEDAGKNGSIARMEP